MTARQARPLNRASPPIGSEPALLDLLNRIEPTSEEIREAEELSQADGFALALARFKNGLEAAGTFYNEESDWVGVRAAINATAQFLRDVPALGHPGTFGPFSKLIGAFMDLENGTKPALFRAEPLLHRSPDPIDTQSLHGYAAGAMELLMHYANCKKKDAAHLISRELRKCGVPLGNVRSSEDNTVAYWRDKARSGNQSEDHDAYTYNSFLAAVTPVVEKLKKEGNPPEAIKRWLLDRFGEAVRAVRGKSI